MTSRPDPEPDPEPDAESHRGPEDAAPPARAPAGAASSVPRALRVRPAWSPDRWAATAWPTPAATTTAAPAAGKNTVAFYGTHQAGIATPAQDRLAFAAFDVTTSDRRALQTMLGLWSAAAARMAAGEQIGAPDITPEAPPIDTGEALGLSAARLTVTVGFGPSCSTNGSVWPGPVRPPWPTCPRCPGTTWTRTAPAATCASRPAPTTRPWPST